MTAGKRASKISPGLFVVEVTSKSGDVVEADCWLAGQFFRRDRVVGHCLTAWRLALRTTEKETALEMKGLNLVLPNSELRSCVNVEVAVLGSQSLKVCMVSVDVKRHWTWTLASSELRSCVKVKAIQSSGAVWKSKQFIAQELCESQSSSELRSCVKVKGSHPGLPGRQ